MFLYTVLLPLEQIVDPENWCLTVLCHSFICLVSLPFVFISIYVFIYFESTEIWGW